MRVRHSPVKMAVVGLALILTAYGGAVPCLGAPRAGPSLSEDVVDAFVAAFNSGSTTSLEDWVRASHHPKVLEAVPAEILASRLAAIHSWYGPLHVKAVDRPSETAIAIWARGAVSGAWVGFQLSLAQDGSGRVVSLGRETGALPPTVHALTPAGSDEEFTRLAGAHADRLAASPYFSGVMLVARGGTPLLVRAIGERSPGGGGALRDDTPFPIASISKLFTAVAIAKLVESGALSYDTTLAELMPEYPRHIAEQVRVRHLLTHTSGIELDEIPEFMAETAGAASMADLVAAQITHLPKLENYESFSCPTPYNYTNEGYALLARNVELKARRPYWEFIADEIAAPSGMETTVRLLGRPDPDRVAQGLTYYDDQGRFLTAPRTRAADGPTCPHPAGGLVSTAPELLAFTRALFDGRLIGPEARDEMLTPRVRADGGSGYGMGFSIESTRLGRCVGHGGDRLGWSSRLAHYPETGHTVIVLANMDVVAHAQALVLRELLPAR